MAKQQTDALLSPEQRAWAEAFAGKAKFMPTVASRIIGIHHSTGLKYSNDPDVVAYVRELQLRGAPEPITDERIISEIGCIAFSDLTEVFSCEDPRDLPEQTRRAIKSIRVREGDDGKVRYDVTLHSKTDALKLLAVLKGMIGPAPEPPPGDRLPGAEGEVVTPDLPMPMNGPKLGGLTLIGPAKTKPVNGAKLNGKTKT